MLVGAGVGGGRVAGEGEAGDLRCMSLRNCGRGLRWVERAGSGTVVQGGGQEAWWEATRWWWGRRLEDWVALAAVVARGGGRGSAR